MARSADYDVIVIGAGAAGGIVACVLCENGKRVLLIERGPALEFDDIPRDHLRNQRISLYGHNAGPEINSNPRTIVDAFGAQRTVRPHEPGYQNNAACVGGGTRVYGAQAWRYMEQDFRMASIYGVPSGSSLADWPLTYAELEPWYERAEWEIGVAGDSGANSMEARRQRPYPMPPVAGNRSRALLEQGAASLGWNAFTPPLAINTVPRAGREACIQCTHCVGFACPSNSKNGTQNTVIPRALATGLCTLLTNAQVTEITTNGTGDVDGVRLASLTNRPPAEELIRARTVVISCGAIESARLLLNSRSGHHPRGLGNEFEQVGRNLQGHYYPGALAVMSEQVYDGVGPGVSIATCQFNHGNPGIVGGGMLANEFIKLPIIAWYNAQPPDVPRWGAANKQWMRNNFTRTLHVMGPVQDIPNPNALVTVDTDVRDGANVPVARLSGTTHLETVRTAEFMRERAEEWLWASGAERVWSNPVGLGLSAGQHQAGTCRMGNDPQSSVTDQWGRVHGHSRLRVIDASLHVTNGGFNPALTIMALAFRCAEKLASEL